MSKLFKTSISFILEDKTSFKNLQSLDKVITSISKEKYPEITNSENQKLFKTILIKYVLSIYFILNKTNQNEIVKICNTQYKDYINPEILLSINNNNRIINTLFKSTEPYITKELDDEQINALNKITKPKELTPQYIYECLQVISFPTDKIKLNKISNDEIFKTTETSTIEYIKNNIKKITLLELNSMINDPQTVNLSYDIYDFLLEKNKQFSKIKSVMNSKIVIPITSEVFLKNQPNIKYQTKDKSITKLNFITTKISNVLNNIEKIENSTLYVNDTENVNLIADNPEHMTKQLQMYLQNSYLNYSNSHGLLINTNKPLITIRESLITTNQKNPYRSVGLNVLIDIIGFGIIINETAKYKKQNYQEFIKSIKHYIKGTLDENVYWIYDKEEDKKYILSYTSSNEIMNYLYENLYNVIIDQINKQTFKGLKDKKEMTENELLVIINTNFKNFPELVFNNLNINKLRLSNEQKNILKSKIITENKPDKYKDNLYGLDDNYIKLPDIKLEKKKKVLIIDTSAALLENMNNKQENAVCIHVIELENISKLINNDPIRYNSLMQEFVYKYVGELDNGTRVCKSCGEKIFLDRMGVAGSFDEHQHFNISSIDLLSGELRRLSDIKEYRAYKETIKILDGLVNKIGKILNLLYLAGDGYEQKKQRNVQVKSIIDMIKYNTQFFDKKTMDARYELGEKEYGINKSFTDFFSFDLTDDILRQNENTKDYQKNKKINNIMIYILINLILSIDEKNIYNMSRNNKCDINSFKKFLNTGIFKNIKIKLENSTEYITKYPVLCYLIFIFACFITQYGLYIVPKPDNMDKKQQAQLNTKTMIKVIMTTIDIFNSLVESYIYIQSVNENVVIAQMFKQFYNKYSIKLSDFYNKRTILQGFEIEKPIIKVKIDDRIKESKRLEDYKSRIPEGSTDPRFEARFKALHTIITPDNNHIYYNSILNCSKNGYHDFSAEKTDLKCKYCGKLFSELIKEKKTYDELNSFNQLFYIKNIAQKYCFKGENIGKKHNIAFSKKDNAFKCLNCGYIQGDNISEKDLINLGQKYYEKNLIEDIKPSKIKEIKIPEIKKEIIKKFIDLLPEQEINLNNESLKIAENIYTFNYNHLGYRQTPPIVIPGSKITKEFNKYFNKDVFYYKDKNIIVYYDEKTNLLLGYNEASKYVKNKHYNVFKAEIKYSLLNELMTLFDETLNRKNKYKNDIQYINICNFITEYLIMMNLINMKIIDSSSEFNYYITKLVKLDQKIDTKDLFNNWEMILKQSYKNDNPEKFFTLYLLFELTEFLENIKSKELQKLLIELTVYYINYFFKRTKTNLNNEYNILFMEEINKYFKDETLYLLTGDELIEKYVDLTSTSSSSSSSSSASEKELNSDDLDEKEDKKLDDIGFEEGFDIDKNIIRDEEGNIIDDGDEDDAIEGLIDD